MIKPARLSPGQTIGLALPSSPPNQPEVVRFAIEMIESLGYKARPARHLFERNGYLAGNDFERAADLNALFADPQVDAIFCGRGGYGASRLLPLLDYDLIRANPKILIGYSDITSLLLAIYNQTGLVTFHGPMVTQVFSDYTLTEFTKILCKGGAPMPLAAPPFFASGPGRVERENRLTTLQPGRARGRLLGGNLSLVSHLVGTPYLPDLTGAILFLEDVSEPVYSIDRMLTHLWLSGDLQKVAGIVFGKFTEQPLVSEFVQNRILDDVLSERVNALKIPAVMGLMIGHVLDQATLPLGCQVELDASSGTLTLQEEPFH